ncbi:MAG: ATP-binding protein [Pseudomonadota bacterium]
MTRRLMDFRNVSLRGRMLAIFIVGICLAQVLFLVLDTSIKNFRYHSLMKERAVEMFALQAEAVLENPGVELPVRTSIPVSRRSRIWMADQSVFESRRPARDPTLEAEFSAFLERRGLDVLELRAGYRNPPRERVTSEGRQRYGGTRRLPSETHLSVRIAGLPGWINGRIASYAAPEPLTAEDILLNLAIFALVGAIGTGVISGSVRSALSNLKAAAEDVGRPDTDGIGRVQGPVEFHEAVRALNDSRRRVEDLLDQKNVMLGAISHEIRTPLTALRLGIEGIACPASRERAIATVEEITHLLDEILELARDGTWGNDLERYDLTAILADVVADERERGRDVLLIEGGRLVARIRPASIRRLLHNIIGNAALYAGSARVSAARIGDMIRIVVEDDGPGVPEDALNAILLPFQRGENSRSRSTGGAGLGLAIARGIARAHGGDISLANRAPHGLRAEVHLPV